MSNSLPKNLRFYHLVFAAVILFDLAILFDYSRASAHPEVAARDIPNALRNGEKLQAGDLLRSFEVLHFDGDDRVRFVSYLFQIVNVKFRFWLFRRLPPHPSLSLTWIFSLVLSPWLLYRLIHNLTGDRAASWAGISLYCVSIGFLSGLLLLFHPAKPLANFFAILCLYLASGIVRQARRRERYVWKYSRAVCLMPCYLGPAIRRAGGGWFGIARRCRRYLDRIQDYLRKRDEIMRKILIRYSLLLGLVLLSFFTDETAWYIFICLPVLFPAVFSIPGKRALFIGWYLALLAAFLLFVTFGANPLVRNFGFKDYDFWSYTLRSTDQSGEKIWETFRPANLLQNGYYFISEQISPFPGRSLLNYFSTPAVGAVLAFFFIRLDRKKKKLAIRLLAVIVLFLLFQTVLLSRHLPLVESAWYYGAMFSIFFALMLAGLLSVNQGAGGWINRAVLLILVGVGAFNTWRRAEVSSNNPGLTFSMAKSAWEKRNDRTALRKLELRSPRGTGWLFRELGLPQNLFALYGAIVSTSPPAAREGSARLCDGDFQTCWRARPDRAGDPVWVAVDFEKAGDQAAKRLEASPCPVEPGAFFRRAEILASRDGAGWETLATFVQDTAPCPGEEIFSWEFDNQREFRHYRVVFRERQGGESPDPGSAYALAELGLFTQ